MKTKPTRAKEVKREWHLVDAQGKVLGRLATRLASLLMGKTKPYFVGYLDCGDYVVIVNAEKIHTTGQRLTQKKYYRHSGYPGGLKEVTLRDQLQKFPNRVLEQAVRGMLPKNRLGRQMFKKLKVYAGPDHPHQAQQPKVLDL